MKQQMLLPCIPLGATGINNIVGVFRDDNIWIYFLGGYPIHSHKADDWKMFRLVTSQLIESGGCRQILISSGLLVCRKTASSVTKISSEKADHPHFSNLEKSNPVEEY